jgi:hypothetical protein
MAGIWSIFSFHFLFSADLENPYSHSDTQVRVPNPRYGSGQIPDFDRDFESTDHRGRELHQPVRRDINEIFSDDVNFQNDYRRAHEEDMLIDVISAHHVLHPIPVQKYVLMP